jgi:hypothetical protein
MRKTLLPLLAVLAMSPLTAQRFEFGAGGGGSFYTSREVTNARGTADAGFKTGFAATAHVGHNMYNYISGEIRYSYLRNDAKLENGNLSAKFGAESHVVHYDLLFHTAPQRASVRPYISAGGGVKLFRGTGDEVAVQPLGNIALLTRTTDTVPVVSIGAGVKFQISPRYQFRVDVRDYLSPFPKNVITPNAGSEVGGWIHNIVPTAAFVITY